MLSDSDKSRIIKLLSRPRANYESIARVCGKTIEEIMSVEEAEAKRRLSSPKNFKEESPENPPPSIADAPPEAFETNNALQFEFAQASSHYIYLGKWMEIVASRIHETNVDVIELTQFIDKANMTPRKLCQTFSDKLSELLLNEFIILRKTKATFPREEENSSNTGEASDSPDDSMSILSERETNIESKAQDSEGSAPVY